ncbi:MAG: substrate-binding domain-containing protein [Rhodovarius sp.]|nr:substrate-binding domain-containing protein [Rhodovarius sp.]
MSAHSSPCSILSTLGVQALLLRLLPRLDPPVAASAVGFGTTLRLREQITAGARAQLAILTDEAIRDLAARGILDGQSRRELALSWVGLAVRAGAPHPSIATLPDFLATLRALPSIVYSQSGASGLFFADLIERLGMAEEIRAKAMIIPAGFTAEPVARGEAAAAIQQISELMAVPGVEIVGPLPPEANAPTRFSAALFADAPPAAARLLDAIAAAMTPAALAEAGLSPP